MGWTSGFLEVMKLSSKHIYETYCSVRAARALMRLLARAFAIRLCNKYPVLQGLIPFSFGETGNDIAGVLSN